MLYGTNDDTSFPGGGAGLVQIDLDGTVTYVSPYPAGETDIDGLAVGDNGRAYLIEDEAGATIHIYDFATNTYVGTLNTPWSSTEIFSAGAWAKTVMHTVYIPYLSSPLSSTASPVARQRN